MAFCTRCGNRLARAQLAGDTLERGICVACGHVHYDNPKVLVWCFAHWRDRLLLCRRAQAPAQGLWNPPAGFVEAGETLEEAAAREMREEAGIDVLPSAMVLYRVASVPHMNEIYVGFRTELAAEPILTPGPEVLEARFWEESELPVSQLAFRDMLHDVPEDFFRCLRTRDFPVFAVTVRRPV